MFCSFASYFRFSILLCTSSEGNLDCAMLCISLSRAKRLALSCKMLDSNDDSRRLRRRWGKGDNTEILFTRFKLRVKFIFYVASCCCVVVVCIYSIYSSSLGWWDAQPNDAWKMVMKVVQNHNEMIYFFINLVVFIVDRFVSPSSFEWEFSGGRGLNVTFSHYLISTFYFGTVWISHEPELNCVDEDIKKYQLSVSARIWNRCDNSI